MDLASLANLLDARVLVAPRDPVRTFARVYAGDRMSDLLAHADDTTLLVTHLNGPGLVRLFDLMEVAGVCMVADMEPDDALLAAARDAGAAMLSVRHELYETCGIIHGAFAGPEVEAP